MRHPVEDAKCSVLTSKPAQAPRCKCATDYMFGTAADMHMALAPDRWSYLGLGEPLCFIAFGPLATTAFYLAQVCPSNLSLLPQSSPC